MPLQRATNYQNGSKSELEGRDSHSYRFKQLDPLVPPTQAEVPIAEHLAFSRPRRSTTPTHTTRGPATSRHLAIRTFNEHEQSLNRIITYCQSWEEQRTGSSAGHDRHVNNCLTKPCNTNANIRSLRQGTRGIQGGSRRLQAPPRIIQDT